VSAEAKQRKRAAKAASAGAGDDDEGPGSDFDFDDANEADGLVGSSSGSEVGCRRRYNTVITMFYSDL